MSKWLISEQAQNDIKDIRYFTKQQWGVHQSVLYIKQIMAKIDILIQNPYAGINRSDELGENIRSILVGSHMIYYEYDTKTLTIQAILHQAMTPEIHLCQKNT